MSGWLSRVWETHVLPVAVERCCGQRSIERQRDKILPSARGRVLEIGVGSGLNLAHYDPSQVEEIVAVDPSPALLRIAERRARERGLPVRIVEGRAEDVAELGGGFDTVVLTYTLCSIPDPARALAEVRRALAPGGKLVLSEHGQAPDRAPLAWQRRLDPVWSRLAGGCHLDRPVRALLEEAGFDVSGLEAMYLPGWRWLNYHFFGVLPRREDA